METRLWAIFVMVLCTLFTAVGQVFMKTGADGNFSSIYSTIISQGIIETIMHIFTNPVFYPLIFIFLGLVCYGLGWFFMVWSFKGGELSVLYPVFAVNYIWVAILAAKIFGEVFNTWKIIGVLGIVLGISLIGIGGRNGN